MEVEKLLLSNDIDLSMFKTLLDSMSEKERLLFLSYQAALGIRDNYDSPADLVIETLGSRSAFHQKIHPKTIKAVITAFAALNSPDGKQIDRAINLFFANVFAKGICAMIEDVEISHNDWFESITDRLIRMIDGPDL